MIIIKILEVLRMKSRRTKNDMQRMESDVRYYLSYNNYDAQKAYNNYIKDYLLSGQRMPHYINGLKDFIKFESIMKAEQEQREQQKTREHEEKEQKKNIIEQIQSITVETFVEAYRKAKETGTEKHKMALCDMAMLQKAGDLKEKYITYDYINICRQYQLI
jgi:hypothetical protein